MNNTPSPVAICVLGAHRSGTSTITRGLNLLGAYLGEENNLMKPLPENPEGFWERLDIYHLQNSILSRMRRAWDSTAPLPQNWYQSEEISPLKNNLFDLVKNNFSGRKLWLWKDPRTCLLLPLWKEVLFELGINLKVVFVVRNPLDVARSLKKRNGFTTDKGLGVWFNCTLSALQGLDDLITVFVSYDRFLDDWKTELKRCAKGLGIEWPTDETDIKAHMASFVRCDLRHNTAGLDELRKEGAPEPIILLFELLLKLLAGKISTDEAAPVTQKLYRDFYTVARLFDYDMAQLEECRMRLAKAVNAPQAQLSADKQLQKIRNSMSWKITKPLRVIHGSLLRFRKEP